MWNPVVIRMGLLCGLAAVCGVLAFMAMMDEANLWLLRLSAPGLLTGLLSLGFAIGVLVSVMVLFGVRVHLLEFFESMLEDEE